MKKNEPSVSESVARPIGVAVLLALVVGVILTAFAWPSVNAEPREVPVALVAPGPVASQLEQRLEEQQPGAFDLRVYPDRASAEQGIQDRAVYGAIILERPGSAQVLTASGASPAVAQALTQVGSHLSGTPPAPVQDVVPGSPEDPRGAGLSSALLPILLGGILTSVAMSRLARNLWVRVTAIVLSAACSGVVVSLVLDTWLGALGGDFWSIAAVAACGIAAIALPLAGLHALAGYGGLGLGAATIMLLGNPLSGITSAPEMLPSGWSTLGQLLPPGACGSAMRSVAFFGGAAAGTPLLVLACWALSGLVLIATAALRTPPAHRVVAKKRLITV